MDEIKETKKDLVHNALMAGLSQLQISNIIKCSQAHVSNIASGKRNLSFSQAKLLQGFLDDLFKKSIVSLIPMPITEKELKQMLQKAMHDQEGDEMEFEEVDPVYHEVTEKLTSQYRLVSTIEEYDVLTNDHATRLLRNRHVNITKRRLDLLLAIKSRATYIAELKVYIDHTLAMDHLPSLPDSHIK